MLMSVGGCSSEPLTTTLSVLLPDLPPPLRRLVEPSGYRIDWYDRFRGPRSTFAGDDAGTVQLEIAPTAVGAIVVTPLSQEAGLQLPAAGIVLGARRGQGPFETYRLTPTWHDGAAADLLHRLEVALGEGATVNPVRVVEAFREAAAVSTCVDVERVASDAVAGRLSASSFSPLPSYDVAAARLIGGGEGVWASDEIDGLVVSEMVALGYEEILCPGLNQFLGFEARIDVYVAADGDIRMLEVPRPSGATPRLPPAHARR